MDSIEVTGRCSLRQRSSLPSAPGIYFVTNERDDLLYIGQATNLRSRWAGRGHHRYNQLARKGLDKITLSYVLAPVAELDNLERQYIQSLSPLLNDGRVKVYLPKKSPRLSELQRILKLVSTPSLPSAEFMTDQKGNTFRRPAWQLFRGFVAGAYMVNNIPRVVIVCQQNMAEILDNSATHRTKKRFYRVEEMQVAKSRRLSYYPIWKFNARVAIFEFVKFYTQETDLFEKVYPHLEECQILGVKLKKLNDAAHLHPILQELLSSLQELQPWWLQIVKTALDYLCPVCERLQTLPPDFALDEKTLW